MTTETTRIFLKKHFPRLYLNVRRRFFGLVQANRSRHAKKFSEPQFKTVRTNGQSFTIKLDPQNGFVDRTIFTAGVYEPDILAIIKKYLPRGGTFIDIGANIGQHSLFAATVAGELGQVIAFEPINRLANQFTESIVKNGYSGRITLHKHGCSSHSETVEIKVHPTNAGGTSLHRQPESSINETISLIPADELLENVANVDLVKIDTEGHEPETLQGLVKTLNRTKPAIIIEYSPVFYSSKKTADDVIFGILTHNEYRLYDTENGFCEIINLEKWLTQFTKQQTNILCLPPSSHI